MEKLYERINFENAPSKKTPLNEENMNKMDKAISNLDDRIIEETTNLKSDLGDTSKLVNWLSDTYIRNGESVSSTRWKLAEDIRVFPGEKVFVRTSINGDASICVLDKNKKLLANYTYENGTVFTSNNYVYDFTITIPNDGYYLAVSSYNPQSFPAESTIIKTVECLPAILDVINDVSEGNGMYYFACGDSITHANHAGIETISDDDKHCPVGGSQGIADYKKKGYPYYIAKKYDLKWFNYGIGGSTLTHCIANGESKNGFMTPGGRYTQLDGKVTPDYISIFFGWNDNAWGVIQHIEKWLKETYGATIYYPMSTSLIGTVASDGTPYTTQEQYNAVNAYATEHPDYFVNQFIGDKNSVDVTTWYGAWNVLLEYLILKYPFAKIMPIVPYDVIPQMKEAVRDVCGKWGVACYDFDFDASEHQIFLDTDRNTTFNTACGFDTIRDFRKASLLADGLHPNTNGYKYMSGSIGAKLMSI